MAIPNWIQKRYLSLCDNFKEQSFKFTEAALFLNQKFKDPKEQTKIILSELKKAGYLKAKKSPQDAREKIYTLTSILETSENHLNHKQELIRVLKKAADIIRTRVDYSFILLLLFYKRLSDKYQKNYQKTYHQLLKDGFSNTEALKEAANPVYHDLDLPKEYLWEDVRKDPLKLSENLSRAMKMLAEKNPALKDIFTQFDFLEFTRSPENNEILRQLFELFSSYSFEKIPSDTIGDSYEWILKYFAPQKAKEGEVYTPREVIRLMVEILKPEPLKSVYDPAMGSGGMLITAYQYAEEHHGQEEANRLFLYGQESNLKTLALAKMNILVHEIKNINLAPGDTLLFPKFKTEADVKKFDYVIANPPWNQDGYEEGTLKRGELWRQRFLYGFPTKQSADWAWIQHMLASAKQNGKVAVVIDTGAASRGGREKGIRQKFIEEDLIEAVILLPEKLFYNTGAPGLVMVFNKEKSKERKGKILLINATKEFEPGKPQNILGKKNIEKIVKTYDNFKEIDGFSKIVTQKEIEEADFNLSPSRFVLVADEEVYRPLNEIIKDLHQTDSERQKIEKKVEGILRKIRK
jgi:type I restriction enzyme M protein